jgi:hypothetical protein
MSAANCTVTTGAVRFAALIAPYAGTRCSNWVVNARRSSLARGPFGWALGPVPWARAVFAPHHPAP